MHHAPAVRVVLSSRRRWAALAAASWLPGLLALAVWASQESVDSTELVIGAVVVLAAACVGVFAWRSVGEGELAWADGVWSWNGAAASIPGRAIVRADVQAALLLEFVPSQPGLRPAWMLVRRSGQDWHALRLALADSGRS